MTQPGTARAAETARLEAEARYHRDRLALYRARMYGGKSTSVQRLRELEKIAAAAEARAAHERRASPPAT